MMPYRKDWQVSDKSGGAERKDLRQAGTRRRRGVRRLTGDQSIQLTQPLRRLVLLLPARRGARGMRS
jgi:hypothetical protein